MIDDGSTQFNEKEITALLQARSSLKYKIIKNGNNLGTVKTLNRAIAVSSGRYIFSIGADDCFYDDRVISFVVSEFELTDALVITGRRMVCDESLKELYPSPSKKVIKTINSNNKRKIFDLMSGSNQIVGSSTIMSRECIERYGTYDEKYRLIEDYPKYMSLIRNDVKILFMEKILIKYRQGGVSSIGNFNSEYEQESDHIFHEEILPFAPNPSKTQKKYTKWKTRTIIGRTLAFDYGRTSKIGRFKVLMKYFFKSPYATLVFIRNNLKR